MKSLNLKNNTKKYWVNDIIGFSHKWKSNDLTYQIKLNLYTGMLMFLDILDMLLHILYWLITQKLKLLSYKGYTIRWWENTFNYLLDAIQRKC